MRLLLVDHSDVYREVLGEALADVLAASVTEAATDAEGLAALEAEEPFDCVLVELHVPHGGGLSLVHEIRARGGPPVIVMTPHERPTDRREAERAGAAGWVDKTNGLDPVLDAIRSATGQEPL